MLNLFLVLLLSFLLLFSLYPNFPYYLILKILFCMYSLGYSESFRDGVKMNNIPFTASIILGLESGRDLEWG